MKTITIKVLASVVTMSVALASASASNHNNSKQSPSKPVCHDNCRPPVRDCHPPVRDCHPCQPCDCHWLRTCPTNPGTNSGMNPGTNPGTGGGRINLPKTKYQYRLECEYKQGYGFGMYVRTIGTYNTRAEANSAAASWQAQGYATRIIEVPVRTIPGQLRPLNVR